MATNKIRSFSSTPVDATDPIEFEFDGEKFEAFGQVTGAVLLEFIAASSARDGAAVAAGIVDYLKASMDEANYRKFKAITHDPKKNISIETLSEIVSFLIEKRAEDRPTEAS